MQKYLKLLDVLLQPEVPLAVGMPMLIGLAFATKRKWPSIEVECVLGTRCLHAGGDVRLILMCVCACLRIPAWYLHRRCYMLV